MKKTKFLALILVVAITVMGAGYAYWTQELKITNTVSTGDLDVRFVPLDTFAGDYLAKDYLDGDADYMNVTIEPNSEDTIGFNINKIYPGAGGFIGFAIVNQGTVPAKLSDIVLDNVSGIEPYAEDLFAYISSPIVKFTKAGVTDIEIVGPAGDFIEGILSDVVEGRTVPYDFEDVGEFEVATSLNGFKEDLASKLDDVTLAPGEFIVINGTEEFWIFHWDWSIDFEEYDFLNAGYSIYMPSTVEEYESFGLEGSGLDAVEFDLQLQYQQQE
jgi:predicted ribosomally synthesized peptide with SipW-like signal peptide